MTRTVVIAGKEYVEHPCIDCGEPTLNEERCRECDLDYIAELQCCTSCGWRLLNQFGRDLLGFAPSAHDDVLDVACPFVAL
jgi:predicted RNA-binding Zn-ribbon protein involved in translation (DUF1610 family)